MKNNFKKTSSDILFFKRWSKKGYGVFRTQGKLIAISTMVMASSVTFEAKTLSAQTDSTIENTVHQLDEVIVNGEDEPLLFSKMARIVTVVNQRDIEAAPVSDLNELLEYATGLDIRQRGQKGVQADIALRGGTFDQTLVLLNGINITDPQTGHHNLNLPIDLSSIERIEIISGPGARIYGVNSFTGVINIITNSDANSEVSLMAKGGQYGYLHQSASLRVGEKWKHFVTASHKKSDGYLPQKELNNTDFTSSNIFYQGNIQLKNHYIDLQTGYNTKAFGANSFYTPAYPEQFEATKTLFSSIKYEFNKNQVKTGASAYIRRHHDRFELFRDTAPEWYTTHNYHMTDVAGGNIPLIIRTRFGNLSSNASMRYAHIYSNVLGKNMAEEKKVPGENAFFSKQDERFHFSLQANYSFETEKFHFAAGILTSHYNILKRTRTYPGIEASYKILNNISIFSSYNEALRLPTFTDLYYNGPTNIGNPDLKPEESKTIEAGLKYVSSFIRMQSALFYRKGENIIEWVKPINAAENIQWQTQNLTNLNTIGVDFDATFDFKIKYENPIIEKVSVNYSWLKQTSESKTIETKYVADYLKNQMNVRLTHRIYKKLYSNWGLLFQEREGQYTAYENNSYGDKRDYSLVTLLNWKLSWKADNWTIFTEIANLLNQKYFDISNVPQPGRWIQVGASYKIANF